MDPRRSPVDELQSRLRAQSGFADEAVASARLASYLAARARELGCAQGDEVALRALAEPAEFARLEAHFAPAESWLFRYPESFEFLRERAASARAPWRVLVLGAGGWSEPVSIAAALAGSGARIEAVDRNGAVFAEPARFAGARVRGGVPDWAMRVLGRDGDGFRADDALLAAISTRTGDAAEVAREHARRGMRFDAVFFRNVAIYMGAAARRGAFEAIAPLVAQDGLLFVGHAETTVAAEATGLELEERGGAFVLRPAAARPVRIEPPPPSRAVAAAPMRREPAAAPPRAAPRAAPRAGADSAADAMAELRAAIAARPLDASLHLALARLLDERGDRAEAAAAVGRALYVDPSLEEALVLGARLAEERGAADEARRLRMRALEAHLGRNREADPQQGA